MSNLSFMPGPTDPSLQELWYKLPKQNWNSFDKYVDALIGCKRMTDLLHTLYSQWTGLYIWTCNFSIEIIHVFYCQISYSVSRGMKVGDTIYNLKSKSDCKDQTIQIIKRNIVISQYNFFSHSFHCKFTHVSSSLQCFIILQ